MPRIEYIAKRFTPEHEEVIGLADGIVSEYSRAGFKLTLRQLYYQLVARGFIENSERSYKRVGSIINDARIAGLIDWSAIEDRGRNLVRIPAWKSPREIVEACAEQFQLDPWETQPSRVEVWIEKEALIGVIGPTCQQLRVPHLACKGYLSQSEAWEAGHRRFLPAIKAGKEVVVIYLGDHDPSGLDMTRDLLDRLTMFARGRIKMRRIALNWDQIEEHQPPPNPAKSTDSRFSSYVEQFGSESWELDALEPQLLASLVSDEVAKWREPLAWAAAMDHERAGRALLESVSNALSLDEDETT